MFHGGMYMDVKMDICPVSGQLVAICANKDCQQPLALNLLPTRLSLGEHGPAWIEGEIHCSRCADRARDERDAVDPFTLAEQARELAL
jgi:hypothetical protein